MIVNNFSSTSSVKPVPYSQDSELQALKAQIEFMCNQPKHDSIVTKQEHWASLLKPHFSSMLKKVPESTFLGVVSNILQDLENPQLDSDNINVDSNPTFKRIMEKVKHELEIIYEEIEEENEQEVQREAEIRKRIEAELRQEMKMGRRTRGQSGGLVARNKETIIEEDGEDSPTRKYGKGYGSNSKFGRPPSGKGNKVSSAKPKLLDVVESASRKWMDTRKVSNLNSSKVDAPLTESGIGAGQYNPRNNSKSGELYKLDGKNYLQSLMDRHGPEINNQKKKTQQTRTASRGMPSGSKQASYFDQPVASTRKKRNSVASSNLSGESDGPWSNARMLRYFVKEAVQERQGADNQLDVGILNRSLSEASLRIFNIVRDKEPQNNNSPLRILDGKNLVGNVLLGASRDSTLSAKKKSKNNLIYDQDDRSQVHKDRELSNVLRESARKFYQQHVEYS